MLGPGRPPDVSLRGGECDKPTENSATEARFRRLRSSSAKIPGQWALVLPKDPLLTT